MPNRIIAVVSDSAWRTVASEDLLAMTLRTGLAVAMELASRLAPVHVAGIVRVQDDHARHERDQVWKMRCIMAPLPAGDRGCLNTDLVYVHQCGDGRVPPAAAAFPPDRERRAATACALIIVPQMAEQAALPGRKTLGTSRKLDERKPGAS